MASNDYYNSSPSHQYRHQSSYNEQPPLPPTSSSKPPALYTSTSPATSPYDSYGRGHYYQNSQQTLESDTAYYEGGAGRWLQDTSQYADNIPLKAHAQKNGSEEWMPQNSQYPPSPEGQRPPPLDATGARSKRRSGFFHGKIPWVVYAATLVQVSVFIAEVVRNGTFMVRSIIGSCSFNLRSYPHRLTNHDPSSIQSHDRALNLCSHQHGGTICALHEIHPWRKYFAAYLAMSQHNDFRSL